jgi:hypothetical protein
MKDEGRRMKEETEAANPASIHPSSFYLHPSK